MIDLLISGKINNRLLCEIATHEKFAELMADVEIFIDGIATRTFNDLNSSLEDLRQEILKQNPNVKEDIQLKTLSVGQIKQEDFFCHITHRTWDTILKDIRKNHEHDLESISDNESALDFISNSFKTMRSPGDNTDKVLTAILYFFKIDYMSLPDEDRLTLRKIIKKSPHSKNTRIKHRKKGKKR